MQGANCEIEIQTGLSDKILDLSVRLKYLVGVGVMVETKYGLI